MDHARWSDRTAHRGPSSTLDVLHALVRRLLIVSAIALTLTGTSAAEAQDRWPVFFEATVGRGTGQTDGEYRDNTAGITADVLVGFRIRPAAGAGLIAGGSVGMQGSGPVTDICLPARRGGCVPDFPDFLTVAALIGWESSANAAVRVSGGPTYVRGDVATVGLQGRVDLAVSLVRRISLAVSGRGTLVPDYRGDAFQLASVGIGLRLR